MPISGGLIELIRNAWWMTRWATVVVALLVYTVVFFAAYDSLQGGLAALALIPVVVAGFVLEMRPALLAALLISALNVVFLMVAGGMPVAEVLPATIPGTAVSIVAAWLVNRMVSLSQRLNRALKKRQEVEQSLRQVTGRQEALLHTVPDLVLSLDAARVVTTIHGGTQAGLDLDERILGQKVERIRPKTLARGITNVVAGLAEESPWAVQEVLIECDEEDRIYEIRASASGETSAVVLIRDVTAQQAEQERQLLEEVITAKDQLFAAAAHNLRTPLTAVYGFAKELRRSRASSTPAEIDDTLDLIADQAWEVSMLIDDMLTLTRLDAGALAVNHADVDVVGLLSREIRRFDHDRIPIHVSGEIEYPAVWTDPLRLRQVFRSLIRNAITHGRPEVWIEVETAGDYAIVGVCDQGPGLPPELDLELLSRHPVPGPSGQGSLSLGLGLHLAQRLSSLMGAELRYDDTGGTTRFRLWIPLSPSAQRTETRSVDSLAR